MPASPLSQPCLEACVPFQTAEEAWFWYIQIVKEREDGALMGPKPHRRSGVPRPCEPADIYQVLDRLYRSRRLRLEHLRTLSQYGRRYRVPEFSLPKEQKASTLWREAMAELDAALTRRGVIVNPIPTKECP